MVEVRRWQAFGLFQACTEFYVAVHRMCELSGAALGVVPKPYNLSTYPIEYKNAIKYIEINNIKKSPTTYQLSQAVAQQASWQLFVSFSGTERVF